MRKSVCFQYLNRFWRRFTVEETVHHNLGCPILGFLLTGLSGYSARQEYCNAAFVVSPIVDHGSPCLRVPMLCFGSSEIVSFFRVDMWILFGAFGGLALGLVQAGFSGYSARPNCCNAGVVA